MVADAARVKELFVAALEFPDPAARAAFLDRECGPDADLRRRLDELLAAHDRPASALERPLAGPAPTAGYAGSRESAGEVVGGRYKLLESIGEGGMGEVWVADQLEPIKRRVALKLIKPGMDSRAVLARFEAERQALALMDHPNISKVLDAGTTDDGRPFFVMELVKGTPITQFCDERKLSTRERLELFVPVCQAIQHAHQKGIIHRDVKPSNVLVALHDEKPVPKVIDFGVAKAVGQQLTEKTLYTGFGALVGTPAYMAPEQATFNQLDIDTRSDIYSLGVLLYELLAGSPPFEPERLKKAALDEVLRLVREEEPPRPSARLSTSETKASIAAVRQSDPGRLTKLLRGELDWVVMKALEKDRNRRYETANGFALDVQRYLAGEAVQAVPPSAGYRLRKFARRNKTAIGVAGMVLIFLVLLGSGAGWALRDREAREREIAQETARKLALTEEGIRQALDRGTKSRAELHAILTKPGGVQELLNQPARWELFIKTAQAELAQAQRLAVRAEGSLDAESTAAINRLENQLTSDQTDYDLALRLEKIRLDRATWVMGERDHRMAADEYPKALAGFAVLKEDGATVAAGLRSSPINEQLVAALDDWARWAFGLGNEPLAEQLLAVARQAAPDPAWADRVRQLKSWRDQEALGKLVEEAPVSRLSPQMLMVVGSLLPDRSLRESWRRRAQAQYPADFWLNYELAHALEKTQPLEASGFYRVALAVRPQSSVVYNALGNALYNQKKLDEAIAAYRKAIEIDPKNAYAYTNLGTALYDQEKRSDAVAAWHKAIEIDPKTADNAYNGIGRALKAQGKLDAAVAAYHKAIGLNPKNYDAYNNLGVALKVQGKLDEAIAALRKAIEIAPNNAHLFSNLGTVLEDQKKLDDAITAYRKALEIDPKHAPAYSNLGIVLERKGKLDEAIAEYEKAIKFDPKLVNARISLGNARARSGWNLANNPDPKRWVLKRAVEAGNEAVELAPQSVWAWQYLGWVQYRAGNWKASIEALEKSCKVQAGSTGDAAQWIVMSLAHGKLANEKELPDQERTRHKAEARRRYDQAVKQLDHWSLGSDPWAQAIRSFRAEAAELLGVKEKPK
jgi:tetratricopeptide (TPR) repeat protein/tRNA A-37 threonylcarbamoyl transferase component Bud32